MEFVGDGIIGYEKGKFLEDNRFNVKEDSGMFQSDILSGGY